MCVPERKDREGDHEDKGEGRNDAPVPVFHSCLRDVSILIQLNMASI
jgi:hypothetical protein